MITLFCEELIRHRGDRRVNLGTFYQYALMANPLPVFLERAATNFAFVVWVVTYEPANDKLPSHGGQPGSRDRLLNFGTPPLFWNGWGYGLISWNLVRGRNMWGTSLRTTNDSHTGACRGSWGSLGFLGPAPKTGEARNLKFGVW